MGLSVSQNWAKTAASVSPSSTAILTTLPLASFRVKKFYIEAYSDAENKYKAMEMLATRKGAMGVNDTVYSRIGDPLNISLNLTVSGADVSLSVINNESFAIGVVVTQLTL